MDSISAESIIRTIEDIYPFHFRIVVDSATMVAGCKTTILRKEHRALYTYCYGHALNLAVQDANVILRDTLDTIEEMTN